MNQIQDDNHEVRGSFENKLSKVITPLVHQMAHSLIDALVLLFHQRQKTDNAMAVNYKYWGHLGCSAVNWIIMICAPLTVCGLASWPGPVSPPPDSRPVGARATNRSCGWSDPTADAPQCNLQWFCAHVPYWNWCERISNHFSASPYARPLADGSLGIAAVLQRPPTTEHGLGEQGIHPIRGAYGRRDAASETKS